MVQEWVRKPEPAESAQFGVSVFGSCFRVGRRPLLPRSGPSPGHRIGLTGAG